MTDDLPGPTTVDVIVPVYNTLHYLREAVASVLAQTHGDLRLHVVDDGSPDGEHIEAYVRGLGDPRVHYLRKDNGGPSSARNHGIAQSDAPYVAFLDADDVWYPHKLEQQMALLLRDPALGLVYGHHDRLDENGRAFDTLEISKRGWIFDDLLDGNCVTGSASMVVVPRQVLDRVGAFREDLLPGEDWELWMRIAHDYRVDLVEDRLAGLRVSTSGVQHNFANMANGLVYLLPALVESFPLNRKQRARLDATVLWDACHYFNRAGEPARAREVLVSLLRAHPTFVLRRRNWVGYALILPRHRPVRWAAETTIAVVRKLKKLVSRHGGPN